MKKIVLSLFLLVNILAVQAKADYDLKIAKVLEASAPQIQEALGFSEQNVKIKILEDDQELLITNTIPENRAYAIIAEPGRKYLTSIEGGEVYITDYYRQPIILSLIFAFLVLVILLGGFQGFKAIISLTLTGLAITFFLIPGIQAGNSPILLAVLLSAFATATTMYLVAGWTKKSLAATIGTTGGVAIAGLIAMIIIHIAPLSGLASTEAHILLANLNPDNDLNFQGILAAGIIISSLGAAMDVSISIASAAQEIYETNKNQSKRELFKHCMNIGKDIMGTMVNTLILAYTGASIPLFLLLYNESGLRLLNMEIIATELTAATVGSIGLLLAIPITAAVSSLILKPQNE